jgi:Glycosyl hydrolases family 2/Glycosyl hydrolases family 2, sugar binding domain/Glycosyl hydrolases family 2, TIM barrel domain
MLNRATVLAGAALAATLAVGERPLSSSAVQQPRFTHGPIETRWAKDVSPKNAWPEYPRPQLVREDWLNLNGLWDYAVRPPTETQPRQWDGQILVPFPIESALSRVMKSLTGQERLWYRRIFMVPGGWRHRRVLVHFGAVDWRAHVWVNGRDVGAHQGGYDEFTFDITSALSPSGPQTMMVAVDDPTDASTQPRGKQVRLPRSIWYTSTTGIWQTVWLEPVAADAIDSLRLEPDVDAGMLRIDVKTSGAAAELRAEASDGSHVVARASGPASRTLELKVPRPRLWSPDSPFLYDLTLTLRVSGKTTDRVKSYFGMRRIALGKDARGRTRMLLNGQPQFEFGPLDQGFWPDGLYTAPTDEAVRFDIEQIKALGFNLARKHVKVEPERWYYWCDKLGLLLWQDMPSGDRSIGQRAEDLQRTQVSAAEYRQELTRLVESHANHPSIVMWVPFNEGWGQFETSAIVDLVRGLDPLRLVDSASGWTDRSVGDVRDVHSYPGPAAPPLEERRAAVLGEFGGLGLPLAGHTWQDEKNWGYATFKTQDDLTTAYLGLIEKLGPLVADGLSAAVYTQTTDVEIEVNGLMTYDRALIKMDRVRVAEANRRIYALGR